MPSDRQIAANRKNAQKSTGPKTPEGRAAVRLNGVKHGLTAKTLVLQGESESDFEALLEAFESEHRPSTPTQEALVRQMAMAQWRLLRLYHIESAHFTLRLDDFQVSAPQAEKLDRFAPLALIARSDADANDVLFKLSAMQSRLERSFYKALHELQNLQKQTQLTVIPKPAPVTTPNEPRPSGSGGPAQIPRRDREGAKPDPIFINADRSPDPGGPNSH